MNLLQDYRNIVDKIKEHIKTELEKRYEDISFNNDFLLNFNIKNYVFVLFLSDGFISIGYEHKFFETHDNKKVETFEELFKYIDDVISEEA